MTDETHLKAERESLLFTSVIRLNSIASESDRQLVFLMLKKKLDCIFIPHLFRYLQLVADMAIKIYGNLRDFTGVVDAACIEFVNKFEAIFMTK